MNDPIQTAADLLEECLKNGNHDPRFLAAWFTDRELLIRMMVDELRILTGEVKVN